MKKILIVEGNVQEDNQKLIDYGIESHSDSLKTTISNYTKNLSIDVFNPSSEDLKNKINELHLYDGLIWGGGSMHVYDDRPEIKKQLEFMNFCFEKIDKIFAICWGMQVAVTAAGGDVKRAQNGTNIGISNNIEVTELGSAHPLYKGKPKKFNTPAYNYDEVVTLPQNCKHLSSNNINKIQAINFKIKKSDVWGIQYHPEITYKKMVSLINYRRDHLLSNTDIFKTEKDLDQHIYFINNEDNLTKKEIRMKEVENWLKFSSLI